MKKYTIILLAVVIIAVFAGCNTASTPEISGETSVFIENVSPSKTKAAASPTATEGSASASEVLTPSPTPEPVCFTWNGLELVLEGISDDVDVDAGMGTPSGKFVIVTLSLKEGRLLVEELNPVYKTLFTLTCGGQTYSPVALEAKNASIEEAHMYSDGPVLLYFDLPVDADITGAVFAMVATS